MGDVRIFGHGDGEAVVLVDVHHAGETGTAIANIDDAVVARAELGAELFEDGDLSPASGGANDGLDLTG